MIARDRDIDIIRRELAIERLAHATTAFWGALYGSDCLWFGRWNNGS
jgi:hypothetical protein